MGGESRWIYRLKEYVQMSCGRRSHGVQGTERRVGSLKTREEQSMMHVMSRGHMEGLDVQGPVRVLLSSFALL